MAKKSSLSFADLNGFNCLLLSDIGFWTGLVKRRMPASRFLIQKDRFEFTERARTSTLLCFLPDLVHPNLYAPGRVVIPLSDPLATVSYCLVVRQAERGFLHKLVAATQP